MPLRRRVRMYVRAPTHVQKQTDKQPRTQTQTQTDTHTHTHTHPALYESVIEKRLVSAAKWTKKVPVVNAVFAPVDALLDFVAASSAWVVGLGRDVRSGRLLRGDMAAKRARAARLEIEARLLERRAAEQLARRQGLELAVPPVVEQGERYPLSLTRGKLRSKDGTVYAMPDTRQGGVQRQRKEVRAQRVLDAWWGDAAHPWQVTVEDSDGMWIRVGENVTDVVGSWLCNGTLSLPLPLADVLGDVCPGRGKVLLLRVVDSRGQRRPLVWDDGQTSFRLLQVRLMLSVCLSVCRWNRCVADPEPRVIDHPDDALDPPPGQYRRWRQPCCRCRQRHRGASDGAAAAAEQEAGDRGARTGAGG